jgi:hypothetical protein
MMYLKGTVSLLVVWYLMYPGRGRDLVRCRVIDGSVGSFD